MSYCTELREVCVVERSCMCTECALSVGGVILYVCTDCSGHIYKL